MTPVRVAVRGLAALVLVAAAASALALPPLADPAAWRIAGLPRSSVPLTRFAFETVDGRAAVRVEAEGSYGNLVHALDDAAAAGGPRRLRWSWRLDRPLAAADLRTRDGDDAALKVCALFDLPLDALGVIERAKMRMARALADEWLPAATLCYVWDPALPPGTLLPNAHSPRLRWIVARGRGTPAGAWQDESHDLRADFLRAFGDESTTLPPLRALALGADADNTGGRSLGYVAGVELAP